MAYDPVKAHEYYIKYKKKGLLKGRKKGSKKKTSSKKKGKTTALLGVSASGLNSDGAIEASLIKERLKTEMNNALAKAKTEEEKIAIRKEYSKRANAEIEKLKNDPKFARQKASSSKTSKGSSTKSSKSSSGSSGSTKGSSGSSSKNNSDSSSTIQSTSASTASSSVTASQKRAEMEKIQSTVKDLSGKITDIYSKLSTMNDAERAQAKEVVSTLLDALKKRLKITTL